MRKSQLPRNRSLKEAGRRKQMRDSFHLSLCILPFLPEALSTSALQLSAAEPARQHPPLQHCVNMSHKRNEWCLWYLYITFLKTSAVMSMRCPQHSNGTYHIKETKKKNNISMPSRHACTNTNCLYRPYLYAQICNLIIPGQGWLHD